VDKRKKAVERHNRKERREEGRQKRNLTFCLL
jgi:hypothetical protein